MKKLVNQILIQILLFITSVIFGFKFVQLDVIELANPLISVFTWSLLTMIFVFDFDPIFKIKEKWLIPLIKLGVFGIIALAMWRTGNTNDIIVALSLIATGILAVFIITLFFDGDDINIIDKVTRYTSVLAGALLFFDIVSGYLVTKNWHNTNMLYLIIIIISQVINRINIEYLTFRLTKEEECKTNFSEKQKWIKFMLEAIVQSGFYITMFLLVSKTLEVHLLSMFPEFKRYEIMLSIMIATSIIATHSIEAKKHILLTVTSNIKWVAKFSIRMILLFFTILLLEDFNLKYLYIIGFIFTMVMVFTKFISTNLMSKRSVRLPAGILSSFVYYSAIGYFEGSPLHFSYSDLRIGLNFALSFLFIIYCLHKLFGIKEKTKVYRLETVGVIAAITVSLSIIANTIIFGFAISVSSALSSIGIDDFSARSLEYINIILLSGAAILAYMPISTKTKLSTIIFSTVKWLGIFFIFNSIINIASTFASGLEVSDYVTIAAGVVSIVIARGIGEKRIKFGWVITFGLLLIFTIEFVYMAVTWMNLFEIGNVNFNGFRLLYATYFLLTGFAYVYIRNMRIGKESRVYSGIRFITSSVITSVLFIAMVLGKPAPNIFDLSKIDDEILQDVMEQVMEQFPSVDWCEVLDSTGVGDEIGVDCGNYIILPEQESYINAFRDGVASEYDPFTGTWNINDSYGDVNTTEGTDHSTQLSHDYEAIMSDPAISSSWFDTKSNYKLELAIPFGATRNTVPMPMYADLIQTSEDLIINMDDANIMNINKLTKMDYTIDYRMLNETGTEAMANLMNGSSGTTNNITSGYVEVPSSMTSLIDDLISEFRGLSIGQVNGDYNTVNAISAFINTKYDIISGLPQNPAAMTITDLEAFKWYDNSPISDQMESGTLTYSTAVSLQSLMASRLNIKNRLSNQLVPMTGEDGTPGLFPLGVPRLELVARTPSGGVWTDITVATPVPSNNSGVLVTGLSVGEEIFLRRNVVDSVVDDASFVNHTPTDFTSSNGFIYGENPYGTANVTTSDVAYSILYNPLFTSPMELFTYGSQTYNGSSNGVNISSSFGVSEQGISIPETQLHTAKLPNMKSNDTLRQISLSDYNRLLSSDGSGTDIENSDVRNIAATLYAQNNINFDNNPTVMQIITQARIHTNQYIDDVLNHDEYLKEKYSANRQAFIDAIFVEYNNLIDIDLRIVSGFTANQGSDGTLDANPSHMFELYVDDSNEKWIPLPDYIQSSKQVIASRESQDGTSSIDTIFEVIQDEVAPDESFDNFDYIGKRNEIEALTNETEKSISINLGVEIDITTNYNFTTIDPIFNDEVYGFEFEVISGSHLLTNITDTTFTKILSGTLVIQVEYLLPSTGEQVSQIITINDTGIIPVIFEPLDIESIDLDQIRSNVGNIYSVAFDGNTFRIEAYEDTTINYCAFIEMIHFINSSKPSEAANASNLLGLNNCNTIATNSHYEGVYSGLVDGVDFDNLRVSFGISTTILDTNLGNGTNSSLNLEVHEGEKFDMRLFLEHNEVVGVEVGDIWANGTLLSSDEYLFEMNSSSSEENLVINFEIVDGISTGSRPTQNVINLTVKRAQVTLDTIRSLGDALNGEAMSSTETDYVFVSEPNSNIAYVNTLGNLASTVGGSNTQAIWFLNADRHNIHYDLSLLSTLSGEVDGNDVVDSTTFDQVLLFSKGLFQNVGINDLNAYLPNIDLDLDVILSYSYETTFSYSIDGTDFINTNRSTASNSFRVVDDKLEVTVTETNRTPNELTTISDSGWVFTNKLGSVVSFDVQRLSADNTSVHTNGQFEFNELSADNVAGHEYRIYATAAHSGIVTEDIVVFNVQLNEVDVELLGENEDYYVGYTYDISSLLTVTDWNNLVVTNQSNIVWTIDGGSSFNPTSYTPQTGITDFVASITYAQRTIDYDFTLNIIDKVTENILPIITASDNVETVIGTGANQEYNFTYLEEEAVLGVVNICNEFDVFDIVDNSLLGTIQINNTGICIISSDDSLLDEVVFNLVYVQNHGPDLNVTVNVTRTKSIFDVISTDFINPIYIGRTVGVDLTYYKSDNLSHYFLDNLGYETSVPHGDRDYSIGETVKFEFDVVDNTSNLVVADSESTFIDVEREYTETTINGLLISSLTYNQSTFSLEKVDGVWFIAGTDIDFNEFNEIHFNGKFIAYENETYTVKWIWHDQQSYIVEAFQTTPPSLLVFYVLIGLMVTGIGALIVWKWKTRETKTFIPEVEEEEIIEVEEITKEEELILINELIMDRIIDLYEATSAKAEVLHKGNMTWREYSNLIFENLEGIEFEKWDALTDVLERCSYFKESLEWIHFNYVETTYHEIYEIIESDDKVKTKKY